MRVCEQLYFWGAGITILSDSQQSISCLMEICYREECLQFKKSMNIYTKLHKKSCDLTSCGSTESDSTEDRDESLFTLKTNPLKHKTELCKNFSELGMCPYGNKCRFAHGAHELIRKNPVKSFRKRKCNGFWKNGHCSYGIRCQFGHEQLEWSTNASLMGISSLISRDNQLGGSKLLMLLRH